MVELKNNNIEPKLVSYLLERGGISVPISLLKHEFIIEIEKSLRKESPLILSMTFKKFAKNLEKTLKLDVIDMLSKIIKEFEKKEHFYPSEDDEKIIDYIVKLDKYRYEFVLETIGPLYFLLKIFEEMRKVDLLPKIIEFFIVINSYAFLYELILYQIDRRLYYNIKKLEDYKDRSWYKQFSKINRSNYLEHATAGLINEIFSDVLNLPKENDSIFGGKSETKIFRNKVAHANIFYDEETEEIIISSNKYKSDEFLKLFFRLLGFCVRWLEKSLEVKIEDTDSFKNKIFLHLKEHLYWISSLLLKIERSYELRIRFMNLIISWKKEVGLS